MDDGSHKFVDQLATAFILRPYLSPVGRYVIEDIYPASGAPILASALGGVVLDRRGVKGRFDDVLVVTGAEALTFAGLSAPPENDLPCPFE